VVPFALAAIVAICAELTATTVAGKLNDDAPDGTVVDDGRDRAVLLLLSATAKPPLGAPELNVTVHVVVPAPVIAWFAQVTDWS